MQNEKKSKRLKIWSSATYRITVEGNIDEKWSDHLGALSLSTKKRADKSTVTTLKGFIRDQAELSGLLNILYEMHLPILSVEKLNEKNAVVKDSNT
jgi:hypothetical protein